MSIASILSRVLPSIPSLQGITDKATLAVLEPIKTIIEERTSGPKEWLDRNRLQGINGVLADILTNGGNGADSQLNFSTPPKPENLTASGTFNNIYLRWNRIPYKNHAYTEIWRAEVDNLGDAVKISTARGNLYPDPVDDGTKHYYWIRFVSKANTPGPYNAASGTLGRTQADPARVLSALEGSIGESHLVKALLGDITALRNEKIIKVNANGYVAGIGIAVVDSESGSPTGQVVILADKFAIVTPNNDPSEAPQIPFIVGKIGNKNTVGINGALVVNGTIYGQAIVSKTIDADKLTVGQLSAISADMGDITAGTMRTGTSGDRVEISDAGPYRIWMGSGIKSAANAKFYMDENGNAIFRGTLAAANGVFTGTLDGVDGVFTGTVYAENIIGDVIDRLSFVEPLVGIKKYEWQDPDNTNSNYFSYEYGKKIVTAPVENTDYLLNTINVKAAGFRRILSVEGFGFIVLRNTMWNGSFRIRFTLKIKVNGSLLYESSGTYIVSSNTNISHGPTKSAHTERWPDVPVDLIRDEDATIQFIVNFSEAQTTSGFMGVFRLPGTLRMDAYKAVSEGITYS